ncbi:hypothetical protein QQS21_005236 [Conoideocrella luteorostrata]|uniref:Uncharacterized protein n=1 Tax=Conoideocrella luteorostrata TaxID=1105319 RepID=A0AAJ0G117_9HYPO|nr:hypothetical protein QQS21_005236 [Conoideocrella luteorostrata]
MPSKSVFVFLIYILSVVALQSRDINHLGLLISDIAIAQANVDHLKKIILAQPMPYADSHLKLCYYLRQRFNLDVDGLAIDIMAHEDYELITGSHSAAIDIKKSTAVVDSSSVGWQVGNSLSAGSEASVNVGFIGHSASATLSITNTNSADQSKGTSKESEFLEEVSQTYECPPATICSVQTWTYVAQLKGKCPVIPLLDPVCEANLRYNLQQAYLPFEHQELEAGGFLSRNLSFPSVHGRLRDPMNLTNTYYTVTHRNTGYKVDRLLPAKIVDGVWQPDEGMFKIDYKNNFPCSITTPLFLDDGKPKKTEILIERPLKNKNVANGARAKKGRYDDGMRIIVLRNNIYSNRNEWKLVYSDTTDHKLDDANIMNLNETVTE